MIDKKNAFVYGIRPVQELIAQGKSIDKVWVSDSQKNPQITEILKHFQKNNVVWKLVPDGKLNQLVRGNHQGIIVATSPIDFVSLTEVVSSTFENGLEPFILILDGISDVRNFGAIARTALCAGVHALVIPTSGAAAISEDAVKTSAGALLHLPICKEKNLYNTIQMLKSSGLEVYGISEKGSQSIFEPIFSGPVALIVGSEETGISSDLWKLCNHHCNIPMHKNAVQSLNVSVAAGIAMFQVLKNK